MIELKLTTGEERLLIPVRNSNGQYELVDNTNTVQMVVVLKNTHIEVIDKCNIDIDAYNKEDLSSRLDLLAVEIIENEQSGIEHNEYEEFPTYNVGFMGIDFPSIKNIGIDKKSK